MLEKAYHALDSAYWSKEELLAYEQAEKRIKDYIASLEQKFDEGKIQGKEEGRAEERAKAELQARAELEKGVLQERLAKLAKKMLENGYALEEIAVDTGLSVEEIKGLC